MTSGKIKQKKFDNNVTDKVYVRGNKIVSGVLGEDDLSAAQCWAGPGFPRSQNSQTPATVTVSSLAIATLSPATLHQPLPLLAR